MGGYGVTADLATAPRPVVGARRAGLAALAALASAGFRRYATYRQATAAATFTNVVFGLLRCFVLLATTEAAWKAGELTAGYNPQQIALYCWLSQSLIGVVGIWGWTELGDRIRTGDVVVDLLRPMHPVLNYFAVDVGRAGHAMLTRFVGPLAAGALLFRLYVPGRASTYPLFLVSLALAVLVSFCGRYLVNAVGFWLLDVRGVTTLWLFASGILGGLAFPLHFLPSWLSTLFWVATPFPSMLQAPLDVAVERGPLTSLLGLVAGQAAWAVVLIGACVLVQRRAEYKLVVQGG